LSLIKNNYMKKILLIVSLILLMGLSYGQVTIQDTITINATLFKVNGVEQGMLINTVVLEPAFYYKIVATKTLDWSTITFEELADSLQLQNTQLQTQITTLDNRVNLLQTQLTNQVTQLNGLQTQVLTLTPRPEFIELKNRYEALVNLFKSIQD
jgi:hypothetical protein